MQQLNNKEISSMLFPYTKEFCFTEFSTVRSVPLRLSFVVDLKVQAFDISL